MYGFYSSRLSITCKNTFFSIVLIGATNMKLDWPYVPYQKRKSATKINIHLNLNILYLKFLLVSRISKEFLPGSIISNC